MVKESRQSLKVFFKNIAFDGGEKLKNFNLQEGASR